MPPESENSASDADPLAVLFGLEPHETGLLVDMIETSFASRGLDAHRLVEGLRSGKSIGSALGVPPGLADTLYERAHRWFSAGRPERAEPLFRALCTLDGTVADYWIGHGVCLRAAGRLALAEIAFAMAARLRPGWALPYFHLSEVLASQRRLDAARQTLALFYELRDDTIPAVVVEEAMRLRDVLSLNGRVP
ncbi:MAG: hypothetical protein ACOH2J_16635 [Allorhizobium sp.]